MKSTYDKSVDAMYIYLRKGKYFKSVPVSDNFIVDLDKKRKVIGIEILNASLQVPKKMIDSAVRIDLLPAPMKNSIVYA